MKKNNKTKMQRQKASRRKTWTSAERFANREKNRLRLSSDQNGVKTANRLMAEAEQEILQEAEHIHDEHCSH